MHHPLAVQHSFWLNPDGARSRSIPCCLLLHCYDSCSVLIIQPWTPQSSSVGALAFEDCGVVVFLISHVVVAVVCVTTHTFLWFEPVQAFALWIPVEMYIGPTCTTSGNFCYKFKPRQSWYCKLINSSHSQYQHQVNLFGKTVVDAEINLCFCWLQQKQTIGSIFCWFEQK
jgi:hypothetical protein